MRTCLILERRFRVHVIDRDRLVFDSRVAARRTPDERWAYLYATVRGRFATSSSVKDGTVAYLLTSSEFESPSVDVTFRSWGAPALVVEVALPREGVARPVGLDQGPIVLGAATWAALTSLAEGFAARREVNALVAPVLGELANDSLCPIDMVDSIVETEPPTVLRTWRAIADRIAVMAPSSALHEIATAAGISVAQAGRDVKHLLETFAYLGDTYRDTVLHLRLRIAAQLLTASGVSATEVATAVGYGSLAAMDRAFRDAKLPAPSVIASELAYERITGAATPSS